MLPGEDAPRLDSFSREEWEAVCRKLRPDWTAEDFDRAWEAAQAARAARASCRGLA